MRLSLGPLLLVVELGFLFALAWRSGMRIGSHKVLGPIYIFFFWITAYGLVTSILGARGLYISPGMLRTLPGLWLPLLTVGAIVLPLALSSQIRSGLLLIFDHTPLHWFAYFHALRIAALGTAYKTLIGEFPVYFEYVVGLPDLVFGLSALWIGWKAQQGSLRNHTFLVWNLIGFFIIVPSTPILLQLGLPGPLHLITSLPDARAVFTYPMSIAPMIGVPLFILVNLWAVWGVLKRGETKDRDR